MHESVKLVTINHLNHLHVPSTLATTTSSKADTHLLFHKGYKAELSYAATAAINE